MKNNTIDLEDTLLEEKIEEFKMKLTHHIEMQKSEPTVVYNFIFPDGNLGTLVGYNRGIGPFYSDLEAWEVPVGVYTDTGDYYSFTFDDRDSGIENEPTFRIGDTDYYNRILQCFTSFAKVDPKTGNLIV